MGRRCREIRSQPVREAALGRSSEREGLPTKLATRLATRPALRSAATVNRRGEARQMPYSFRRPNSENEFEFEPACDTTLATPDGIRPTPR